MPIGSNGIGRAQLQSELLHARTELSRLSSTLQLCLSHFVSFDISLFAHNRFLSHFPHHEIDAALLLSSGIPIMSRRYDQVPA
jgi:hypothetical protein